MTKSNIKKKPHTAAYKFKVALAALKGDKTISQLCQEYVVVSSQIYKWKAALLEHGSEVFKNACTTQDPNKEIEALHATIGRLKVENDFLSKVLGK
ncbi:transposase [Holosporaceae bacterium 'Namur']|nr:transposase [Holosporaceae bacterium 'Namur']